MPPSLSTPAARPAPQRRRWLALVAGAVCAVALNASLAEPGACAGTGDAPRSPLVRLAFPQDDGTLTPYTFERGYALLTLVYDTLLWRDEDGVPRPWLARAVETSDDGRRVTVRLVEGARWHDGTPVTARDVAFTFQRVAEHPHPRFTPQLAAVERVDVTGEHTVEVFLRHRSPGFVDQPLADLPVLPRHVWEPLAPGAVPDGLPVGSGPYRLVAHDRGSRYRFEADESYFRGRPTVDALEVRVERDAGAMVEAFARGELDAVPVSLPQDVVRRLLAPGVRVARGPSYVGTVLLLNLRIPPFDRAEVRRAAAAAIDVRDVARAVGGAVPAGAGVLHPASPWAPRRARAPMSRSTVPAGPAPPAVNVLAPATELGRQEAARRVALALTAAGIPASSRSVPPAELSRAVGETGTQPSFEAVIWTIPPLASYDPDFLQHVFGSAGGPLNYTGYRSAAFDDLARRVGSAATAGERTAAVRGEVALLAEDAPVIPLYFDVGRYPYRAAAYDGWVFVKGAGILDKQSFLARPERPRMPPGSRPASDRGPSPVRVAGVALIVAASILGAGGLLVRQRRSRRPQRP